MSHSEKFNNISDLLKAGQLALARRTLREDLGRLIKTDLRTDVASLCRRAGLPELSIRVFGARVRPQGRAKSTATPLDIAEYAAALAAVGATVEAFALLAPLSERGFAPALLFEAFARMSEWDYARARPLLESYLEKVEFGSYEHRVARVNLAAGLVHEQQPVEARRLIEELLVEANRDKNRRLAMNLLELSAQVSYAEKNYARAKLELNEATQLLSTPEATEGSYVRKWILIVNFTQSKKKSDRQKLNRFAREAQADGEWEVARDCDFHSALISNDVEALARLKQQTRFAPYQMRIEAVAKRLGVERLDEVAESLPVYLPGAGAKMKRAKTSLLLDLNRGRVSNSDRRLKQGQLLHRLMLALLSDGYRPAPVAQIFADVFADRHYHPLHAPNGVHQAINRLRVFFEESKWPLHAARVRSGFRLESASGVRVKVQSRLATRYTLDEGLQEIASTLKKEYRSTQFDAWRAAKVLNISHRTALRNLQQLKNHERVSTVRVGRKILYQLKT